MKKIELARIAEFLSYATRKEKYDVVVYNPETWKEYGKEEGVRHAVESASNAAETKLVEGKISLDATYLVSRGKKLSSYKPDAVAEYSSHWPYDYCYFYKL